MATTNWYICCPFPVSRPPHSFVHSFRPSAGLQLEWCYFLHSPKHSSTPIKTCAPLFPPVSRPPAWQRKTGPLDQLLQNCPFYSSPYHVLTPPHRTHPLTMSSADPTPIFLLPCHPTTTFFYHAFTPPPLFPLPCLHPTPSQSSTDHVLTSSTPTPNSSYDKHGISK
jgi:hypothetical protein